MFTLAWDNVVDRCAGTNATAKACMLLASRSRVVGCETDIVPFKDFSLGFGEVFARPVLNNESYIVGEADVRAAA